MALRLKDEPSWTAFLTEAGIPNTEAGQYATILFKNRVTEEILPDLTADHLNTLGITLLGDVLSIIRYAKKKLSESTNNNNNNADASRNHDTGVSYRPPTTAAKLPEITSEMTHAQFRKVETDWHVYKQLTKIPPSEIEPLLYSACDDTVQTNIINSTVKFFDLTEKKMFETLEEVVTRRVNSAVHRKNFRNIKQEENETIQSYLTRIRSAAVDCEFVCPECDLDISRVDIKDQFVQGLQNETLQMDILAKADQLKSFEEVVKHSEAYETALRDQTLLQPTNASSQVNRISDYRKIKQGSKFSKPQHTSAPESCSGCGSADHGTRGTPPRHTHCPAWGKQCSHCKRDNHFEAVCRRGLPSSNACALVCHIQYDSKKDMYSTADNDTQEIATHLTPFIKNARGAAVDIFPDSGANITMGGPKQLQQIGMSTSQLRPCMKRVQAVGGSELVCKGWIPIKFEIGEHNTIQPVYFCERVDRLYFSKQACKEMNMIPQCFPKPMPKSPTANVSSIQEQTVKRSLPPPRPTRIPYPPTTENVPKLKEYILKAFSTSTFLNSDEPFPALNAPPFKIFLKENAIPYAQHTPIPVPHHLKASVKALLDRDIKRGIIKPVEVNTPVFWCAPMVVTVKPDGSIRRTIDYQHLNSQCLRQTHYTDSPFNLASQIPPNTKKTVIDAVDGFHSVKVDEECQPMLIFITEWGRFQPLRLPQGYFASGDAYTHRMDNITEQVPRKLKIIDDTLLHDESIADNFFHTWDYLTLCANNGIVANEKKFQFCQDTVDFAGLNITPTGITPSEKLITAIRDFPTPKDLTGARSWFGLVNQVAWAYSISPLMAPFRDLIKPNKNFYWDDKLDKIFNESKNKIVNLVVEGVQSFEISRRTCLQTDWSEDGLGYVLLQKHCECTLESPVCCSDGWKLIFAGSRFTKPAESGYAPIEGEALALAWALEHSRMFTMGCPDLLVAVDHKPLLGVFNSRDLQSIKNPRLRNFKENTLAWRFSITHVAGKWTRAADALSRQKQNMSPLLAHIREQTPSPHGHWESADTACRVASIQTVNNLKSVTLDDIRTASLLDQQYQDLIKIVKQGFPDKRNKTEPAHLREFWEVRHRLYELDGVIYMDKRTVVPRLLRKLVMDHLHAANQGVTGMRFRANQTVYWPGLDRSINIHRANCKDCTERAPSQPAEPIVLTPSPSHPFQQICADFFHIGGHGYLSTVDRFSGWPSIYHFKPGHLTSKSVINELRDLFIAYGVPEELSNDGGPQFTSSLFTGFLQDWGVKTRLSSVAYPQSNGRAELGVKAAKRIIHNNVASDGSLNTDAAARAILTYRNTPLPDIKMSPAQILLHRNLRDGIPVHPQHYRMHKSWIIQASDRERAYAARNQRIVEKYNSHTRELPQLSVGKHVVVQSKNKRWNRNGRIVQVLPHRQYRVRMYPSGRVTLQNRRFIRECAAEENHPIIPSAPIPVAQPSTTAGAPSQPTVTADSPNAEPPRAPQDSSAGQETSGNQTPDTPPSPTLRENQEATNTPPSATPIASRNGAEDTPPAPAAPLPTSKLPMGSAQATNIQQP